MNTAARCESSRVTNANRPSGEAATSIAPPGGPLPAAAPLPPGADSVPSTAPAAPLSARATLSTATPALSAASRYFPSGVIVTPSGMPGTGMLLTSVGAREAASRRTSIDGLPARGPPTATNAQRPSAVAATPNGLPDTGSIAALTEPSAGDAAVAVLQPGAASARAGSAGGGGDAADGETEAAGGPVVPAGAAPAGCVAAPVHPAQTQAAQQAIAAVRHAAARCVFRASASRMAAMLALVPFAGGADNVPGS